MEANGGGGGLEDELAMGANGGGEGLEDELAMEANGGGGGLEDELAMGANGGGEGLEDELAMEANGGGGGLEDELAMVAVAPRNGGPGNDEARWASVGNPALYLVLLCLPAQEIARCRRICRRWRHITSSEAFRHHHHGHLYRTPMPLFFFLDPKLVRLNLRAVDIRDRVDRPVIRYTRPPNHEVLRIHGSCAGILLLSSGDRLYACNPCTRRWAPAPPLHVENDIIGFYATTAGPRGFQCHVLYLYNDRVGDESNCLYWTYTLWAPEVSGCIGRPRRPLPAELVIPDEVLAKGIVPSYKIPPVFFRGSLLWPPKAGQDISNIIMFDTVAENFSVILSPPSELVPVMGRQLFEIDQHLAMTVISFSPARVDVWVRSNIDQVWGNLYRISLPLDEINRNDSCHHNGSVFAVAHDRNDLVQCPRILLQCDDLGAEISRYQLHGHWTSLSGHTLQESLLLHPNILPLRDIDAVDGNPPFF